MSWASYKSSQVIYWRQRDCVTERYIAEKGAGGKFNREQSNVCLEQPTEWVQQEMLGVLTYSHGDVIVDALGQPVHVHQSVSGRQLAP